MNCHIVPQCYLKSWKIPEYKKSIYVFQKKNLYAKEPKKIRSMSRTNFAKTNEYILDINNTYYMFKFYDEFVETLKECEAKAFYNDIEIDSEELFLENMENISQWTYKTINLNKNADFMHIKKTWENKVGKSIEKYFADKLEMGWNSILDYTENYIMKHKNTVQKKYYDELLEFSMVQFLRRKENLYNLGLDWIFDILKSIFEEEINVDSSEIFNYEFKEAAWIFELYKHSQYKNTHNKNIIDEGIASIKNLFQPCFIISNSYVDFITSDNPCFIIKSNPNYTNGIYLPINKRVCLFMCRFEKSKIASKHYIILEADENNVKYINNLIKRNALNEIAFWENDISKIISNKFNAKSWYKMIETIQPKMTNIIKE